MPLVGGRWGLLAVLTSLYAFGAFGVLGISPLTPAIRDGLGLSRFQIGLLIPAIYVAGLVASLPGGHLADRLGVRATLLGGLVIGAAGLAAGAGAPGLGWLLTCLALGGSGWSVVNPALGKGIIDVFPPRERGVAMGIKQMGLMLGGIGASLVLPAVAARWGWRAAVALCALVVASPVGLAWRPLDALGRPAGVRAGGGPSGGSVWWWVRRPALLVVFGAGLGFGLVQAAVLSYFPLFSIQVLGFGPVGAGALLAVCQVGGAAARLGLGAASDRWLVDRRAVWLVLTSLIGAATFLLYAWAPPGRPLLAGLVAFGAGVGTLGWVGLYLLICAEAGGRRQAGLLSGVGFTFLVVGLLVGGPLFGALLEATDSYAAPWLAVAAVALAVAVALAASIEAIRREGVARERTS